MCPTDELYNHQITALCMLEVIFMFLSFFCVSSGEESNKNGQSGLSATFRVGGTLARVEGEID